MSLTHTEAAAPTTGPAKAGTPATEVSVQTVAKKKALSGRASDIGTSMASGGTGKNELSTNDTMPMIQAACGLLAAAIHQS